MTVADLLLIYVPRLKEFFPEPVEQEWDLTEYLRSRKRVRDRVLAGLDQWRKGLSVIQEKEHRSHL